MSSASTPCHVLEIGQIVYDLYRRDLTGKDEQLLYVNAKKLAQVVSIGDQSYVVPASYMKASLAHCSIAETRAAAMWDKEAMLTGPIVVLCLPENAQHLSNPMMQPLKYDLHLLKMVRGYNKGTQ